jgi:hypothetical protein
LIYGNFIFTTGSSDLDFRPRRLAFVLPLITQLFKDAKSFGKTSIHNKVIDMAQDHKTKIGDKSPILVL